MLSTSRLYGYWNLLVVYIFDLVGAFCHVAFGFVHYLRVDRFLSFSILLFCCKNLRKSIIARHFHRIFMQILALLRHGHIFVTICLQINYNYCKMLNILTLVLLFFFFVFVDFSKNVWKLDTSFTIYVVLKII